ncbi:helicase associated domain-containing protein [Streptomyces sp. SH5]|uniref:helicase associated domain-containing protein n=1 Tax=Streptomyces sp. SH5 TaxID=3041765 RepID=UPI0032B03009
MSHSTVAHCPAPDGGPLPRSSSRPRPGGRPPGGTVRRGSTRARTARKGRVVVPRADVEEMPHGPVRLGTWVSNTRSRRTKLSAEQREPLAALGINWATA